MNPDHSADTDACTCCPHPGHPGDPWGDNCGCHYAVAEVCGKVRRSWMEAETDGPPCTLPKGHEGNHRADNA